MIYVHSLGRALRFYPGRTALARDGRLLTFRELYTRVEGIAATLTIHGFGVGDRLVLLLPNGPDYIELIYACSMLGVIAVPLNTRLSPREFDGVLEDARPQWDRPPFLPRNPRSTVELAAGDRRGTPSN